MREPLRDSERLKHIVEAINNIEKASEGVSLKTKAMLNGEAVPEGGALLAEGDAISFDI